METSSCCAASAFFQVLDFHGSHPSSVRMWDWASMTQVGTRKIWGAALRARLFPRAEWNTLTWCLLRLTYLKCSFCLEPKFSELVFCLTRNSNMSFQIWKPKCSHLSWKIWVPNERLPLKLKISDNWKALAIYFFKQAMPPPGWRQSFAWGRATNFSWEGWAVEPQRFALSLAPTHAAAQIRACWTLSRCWSTLLNSGLTKTKPAKA